MEDYGLITRLVRARTGGPVMTIGGLKHYATQAAAEAVTDAAPLKVLMQTLPSRWQEHNVQIVVRTELVRERPGPAAVVAVHVW